MRFEALPLADAAGHILGHNVTNGEGRRVLRKGKTLTEKHLQVLKELGRESVFVAVLEPDDVTEGAAAERVASAAAGFGLRRSRPLTGRVNLFAKTLGLLRINLERLGKLNGCPGLTLATLPAQTVVGPGKMVATLKVIPYAVAEATVARAEGLAAGAPHLLYLTPLGATGRA